MQRCDFWRALILRKISYFKSHIMDYYISPQDWEKICAFLSTVKWIHIKEKDSLRIFIEAVYYILRTGCQWRMLPTYYGHYRSVHKRFKSWSDKGIWANMMIHMSDIDDQEVMLDSTIVRAHACASGYRKDGNAEQALGRSKGGFTTKIHALVDALGLPIKFILTPGQDHDITQAKALLADVEKSRVLADKAYYSQDICEYLHEKRCKVVIPSRSNAKNKHHIDKEIYKERHLIECFFSKLKQFRRVFSRFDKTIRCFVSFLSFAGSLIWLR